MTHELKIQKQWADAKLAGEKPFEIRRNDRGFQKGDVVRYKVVDPKTGEPWVEPGFPRLVTNENGVGKKYVSGRHPLEFRDFLITYVIEGVDGLEKDTASTRTAPFRRRPLRPPRNPSDPSGYVGRRTPRVSCASRRTGSTQWRRPWRNTEGPRPSRQTSHVSAATMNPTIHIHPPRPGEAMQALRPGSGSCLEWPRYMQSHMVRPLVAQMPYIW